MPFLFIRNNCYGEDMKKIAVINDISGFGKCSLTAALPIISAHGIQCCPLPTGVFSNQTGYESFFSVDLTESMSSYIAEWKKRQVTFDGILTGFIPNAAQAGIIRRFLSEFVTPDTLTLVDPIMGDDGEIYPCYDDTSIAAVKRLAAAADIITPNVTELALLSGQAATENLTPEEIEALSANLGNQTVITTGIKLQDGLIGNGVYDRGRFEMVTARQRGQHFSGTGDVFSAYLLSAVLNGADVVAAVKQASSFIEKAIAYTLEGEPEQHYHPDGIAFEKLLKIE